MNHPKRPSGVTTNDIKKCLSSVYTDIASGDAEFICHAIGDSRASEKVKKYLHEFIRFHVMHDKYDNDTLNSWVYRNQSMGDEFPSDEDMLVYRLRWIEYMMDQ